MSLLLVVALLTPIAGYASEKGEASPETIKVGVIGPRTGRHAYYGISLNGVKFVFEQINSAGGIKSMGGAKLVPVWGDTQSNPSMVIGELERLAFNAKVDVIVSAFTTSEAMAGIPVFVEYHCFAGAFFHIASYSDRLWKPHEHRALALFRDKPLVGNVCWGTGCINNRIRSRLV